MKNSSSQSKKDSLGIEFSYNAALLHVTVKTLETKLTKIYLISWITQLMRYISFSLKQGLSSVRYVVGGVRLVHGIEVNPVGALGNEVDNLVQGIS